MALKCSMYQCQVRAAAKEVPFLDMGAVLSLFYALLINRFLPLLSRKITFK